MADTLLWLNALVIMLFLAGGGLLLYARASQRARLFARAVSEVQRRGARTSSQISLSGVSGGALQVLRHLGRAVPLLSMGQRTEAQSKLTAAGYRSPQALFLLLGLTLLSIFLILGLLVTFARPFLDERGPLAWAGGILGAAYLGTLLPRIVLDHMVKRRQAAIRQSLPDALDLLVICTNAGLALNAALERVADEMDTAAPELSDELKLTATELRISSDIEVVLRGLADRTDLDGMRTLVSTFLQARQYGTAITQALRVLARSERTARMMKLEEKAAKLSVKMTIPLILFILPTVIIVGAGPAVMSLMKTFSTF